MGSGVCNGYVPYLRSLKATYGSEYPRSQSGVEGHSPGPKYEVCILIEGRLTLLVCQTISSTVLFQLSTFGCLNNAPYGAPNDACTLYLPSIVVLDLMESPPSPFAVTLAY